MLVMFFKKKISDFINIKKIFNTQLITIRNIKINS